MNQNVEENNENNNKNDDDIYDDNKKTKEGIIIKNSKFLNIKDSKLINLKDLEFNNIYLNGDTTKNSNNYWYSKFSFLGKPFYQMTRKDKAKDYKIIIYYCNLHNTTIDNNKQGKKVKIRKCNSRIYYDKNLKEYYLETEHSNFCENRNKQNYQNLEDINKEVKNYKHFREELINYLDCNRS